MKNIVILGGSFAGIGTAHRLLKQSSRTVPFKVTLVSPNTHFYWNLAAPLGLIPGEVDDEELFRPIVEGFSQYTNSQFEFVIGSAESLDIEGKKVGISTSTGPADLAYDFLILATGSSFTSQLPFKGLGSTEATKQSLHAVRSQVKVSKTIVVAGAGVSGCEIAGELAFKYGKEKDIILIAKGPTILPGTPVNVFNFATKELQSLGVQIKLQTNIKSTVTLPNGQYELSLSTGEKMVSDMYLPTIGVTPNSSYIPTKYLDKHGSVLVDENLAMNGVSDIWAIGDVSALQSKQLIAAEKQSTHLAKNIILMLNGRQPLPYKPGTIPLGISIGRNSGVAHVAGWRLPTMLIVYVRKRLFLEKMGAILDGSKF